MEPLGRNDEAASAPNVMEANIAYGLGVDVPAGDGTLSNVPLWMEPFISLRPGVVESVRVPGLDESDLEMLADPKVQRDIQAVREAFAAADRGEAVAWDRIIDEHIVE